MTAPTDQNTDLFADFSPKTKKEWIEKATQDLKGKDFQETLVWETAEGISLQPMYMAEDQKSLGHLSVLHQAGFDPDKASTGLGARSWMHCEEVVVENEKDANKQALNALNQGSSAISFDLREKAANFDWATLFQEIKPQYCGLSFRLTVEQWPVWQSLYQYLGTLSLAKDELRGYLQIDGLEKLGQEQLSQLQQETTIYPNFQGLSIQLSDSHEKAYEKVGVLVLGAHRLINKLETQSASAERVIGNLSFHYPLGNSYFFQIAGLKALRLLIDKMTLAYTEGSQTAGEYSVRALTSIQVDDDTRKDPEWNMLSNTTQAMSGILGGSDYLSVLPHNQGIEEVDAFARRIARNVSNLLREESHFDKVADPVAGSYYIEQLIEAVAQKAWAYFQGKI